MPLDKHALWSEPPLCLRRADGTLDVRGNVPNPDILIRWLLYLGPEAKLLSPRALHTQLRAYLQSLLEHHQAAAP